MGNICLLFDKTKMMENLNSELAVKETVFALQTI